MPSPESIRLLDMLRSQTRPSSAPSWEQSRKSMESFARPADADVLCTAVDAGGVPAEWVVGPGSEGGPVLLYLHGGGYTAGSIVTHRQLAGWLSKASGARVLVLDYRLAPEHPHPAAVEDAVAAYQWLLARGTSAARIVIGGDSAGGGLTAATLLALRDRGIALPAAGLLLSPWTDLTGSGDSMTSRASIDPMVGGSGLVNMSRAYVPQGDLKAPLASPLFADLKGLPPLLIHVGTHETLFDDSTRFDAAARSVDVDVTFEAWNGQVHVFHMFAWLVPEAKEAIAKIGAFVKERTATPS